jgi:tRNA pseudouridine38-40 synthase
LRVKLTLEYDGTELVGSQLQAEGKGRTVQGELEAALARLAGEPVRVAMAGRTDRGVHALGQVASLDFPAKSKLDTPRALQRALNGVLPHDLAVVAAENVGEGFHARFSACKRAYRYLVWNAPSAPSPLMSRYSLHVRPRLDTEAMARGARLLEGTHDMAAFAGQGMGVPGRDDSDAPSTVRTVYAASVHILDPEAGFWTRRAPETKRAESEAKGEARLVAVDLVANAFLPQMVRTIVGTLLEIGRGKRRPDEISEILASRDRNLAGPTAKPQGLCLLWVEY